MSVNWSGTNVHEDYKSLLLEFLEKNYGSLPVTINVRATYTWNGFVFVLLRIPKFFAYYPKAEDAELYDGDILLVISHLNQVGEASQLSDPNEFNELRLETQGTVLGMSWMTFGGLRTTTTFGSLLERIKWEVQ